VQQIRDSEPLTRTDAVLGMTEIAAEDSIRYNERVLEIVLGLLRNSERATDIVPGDIRLIVSRLAALIDRQAKLDRRLNKSGRRLDFTGAKLANVVFPRGINLSYARFAMADLRSATLTFTKLNNIDFSNANLSDTQFGAESFFFSCRA
jgi:uncharacterized protein YjbI with pentapeptide repeats